MKMTFIGLEGGCPDDVPVVFGAAAAKIEDSDRVTNCVTWMELSEKRFDELVEEGHATRITPATLEVPETVKLEKLQVFIARRLKNAKNYGTIRWETQMRLNPTINRHILGEWVDDRGDRFMVVDSIIAVPPDESMVR